MTKVFIINGFLLIYWFYMIFLALAVSSESYYSINAPGVIKPNSNYSVVASLHEASGPCSIRVSIEGPNFNESKDVNLQPFESQVIEFSPKKLQEGTFFLKAEGLTGLSFKNESIITANVYAGPNIYIQTDKAIYKPKDLVRFRCVVLDEHMRPLNIADPINVEILDSQNNRVKYFKNISLMHGIFTGKFQLSKYPQIGYWNIKVAIDGNYDYVRFKRIEIKNYILPKFSVYLTTSKNIVLEDGNIKVKICGKYTYNKYVEGNATIELWNNNKTMLLQTRDINLQSYGFINFNLTAIEDIEKYSHVVIIAGLTEKYTERTEIEEQSIMLRNQRYDLIIPLEEIEFENNKPYSIKLYVKYWTGAYVSADKTPVTMQHGDKMYKSVLDTTGSATFEFDYVANSDYKFQFKDSSEILPIISTHKDLMLNSREYYCRLKLLDEKSSLTNVNWILQQYGESC